ncbi:MAG: hypothetical protein M1812_006335 [Candelaria pacifica]|nr:MAG: hypothetical protein M1812_006335 [Candelaria pacifica]
MFPATPRVWLIPPSQLDLQCRLLHISPSPFRTVQSHRDHDSTSKHLAVSPRSLVPIGSTRGGSRGVTIGIRTRSRGNINDGLVDSGIEDDTLTYGDHDGYPRASPSLSEPEITTPTIRPQVRPEEVQDTQPEGNNHFTEPIDESIAVRPGEQECIELNRMKETISSSITAEGCFHESDSQEAGERASAAMQIKDLIPDDDVQ